MKSGWIICFSNTFFIFFLVFLDYDWPSSVLERVRSEIVRGVVLLSGRFVFVHKSIKCV